MFDLEKFDIKLDTEFIGRQFIYAEEIDSTNSFLLDKGIKLSSNGTVVLAEKQSKGRGRKDRVWYSAKDQNLTFSILLTNKKYFGKVFSLINFAASLSVGLSIENLFQLKADFKWPNDILVNGKKIAGILLESTSQGSKVDRLVIGIGINVNQVLFQGNFNTEPTSLKLELNHQTVEREILLAEVLNIFEETLLLVEKKPGEIIKDWKAHCSMIGGRIAIIEGDTIKTGIFDDLDENGFLLLKIKNKIEKIHFGDVSLR